MTYNFEFANWTARLRAPLLAALILILASCNSTDSLTSVSNSDPEVLDPTTPAEEPSFATSFAGGIPIGLFALPTSLFGYRYNGALQNNWPENLLSQLSQIRSRGGKVVLMFAGSEKWYKDGNGHFSFTKWKARVDRFRKVNFSSYIKDGTIVGHYMIDEPHDKYNWNGQPISGYTLEAMAKYSKQIWPSMVTIVREEPGYLRKFSLSYRYLDAAWAQYTARRGDVYDYLRRNVTDAQHKGLALIVGLNLLHGGVPNLTKMSASEVERFGLALLSSSYPCAFVSWKYNSDYLSTSSMRDAMDRLRRKAQNRGTKSCRGS